MSDKILYAPLVDEPENSTIRLYRHGSLNEQQRAINRVAGNVCNVLQEHTDSHGREDDEKLAEYILKNA